ncbi:NifU family protein [Myxococcota bacterium]|nr:NifU family protein [Myxococcota bacterium]
MELGFRMHAERTPNPDSIKWVLGRPILQGGARAHFSTRPDEEVSPLASALFQIDGVEEVFLASNFVTVTKREQLEWTDIAQQIVDAIKLQVGSGAPALGDAYLDTAPDEESPVVGRILELLDREIRPAVARDGGDVVFAGFRDGIVELQMQGACSGCPSSAATLKHGIEARLQEEIPEVRGVAAV